MSISDNTENITKISKTGGVKKLMKMMEQQFYVGGNGRISLR